VIPCTYQVTAIFYLIVMMYVDKCASCPAHNYFSISILLSEWESLINFINGVFSIPDNSTSVILTSNSPSKTNHDGVGNTNVEVLLVYTFVYGTEIEKAAMQLHD